MEVDALTRSQGGAGRGKGPKGSSDGKNGKGKGGNPQLQNDWKKQAECWICGRAGHTSTDCWFKGQKGKDGKGGKRQPYKGKGKGKDGKGKGGKRAGVREIGSEYDWSQQSWQSRGAAGSDNPSATPTTESRVPGQPKTIRSLLTTASEEDVEEDALGVEGGYVFGVTIAQRPEINAVSQTNDIDKDGWLHLYVLTDNCADEHVCGINDFTWIPLENSPDPGLEVAGGGKLTHYGQRTVPFIIEGGWKICITFQVMDVKHPILLLGKYCSANPERWASYDRQGGALYHEAAGQVGLHKFQHHYGLECLTKPGGEEEDRGGTLPITRSASSLLLQLKMWKLGLWREVFLAVRRTSDCGSSCSHGGTGGGTAQCAGRSRSGCGFRTGSSGTLGRGGSGGRFTNATRVPRTDRHLARRTARWPRSNPGGRGCRGGK